MIVQMNGWAHSNVSYTISHLHIELYFNDHSHKIKDCHGFTLAQVQIHLTASGRRTTRRLQAITAPRSGRLIRAMENILTWAIPVLV
jgi:hypothetical protein